MNFQPRLESGPVTASVPCRIDFGGTLDISTFYLPLSHLFPAGFNMALDLRTTVTLTPYVKGKVKISSLGFEDASFDQGKADFTHPMGLMFACAQFVNAHGLEIRIESSSPPRSALGGSSCASVAILAALYAAMDKPVDPVHLTWLSHTIESSVARVPCGVQDQAAAAFGGVNLWHWKMGQTGPVFEKTPLYETPQETDGLNRHILVAYCGIPHESKNINGKWVDSFLKGTSRSGFERIAGLTKDFFSVLKRKAWDEAAAFMNEETALRLDMTPDVLDNTGKKLFESAKQNHCGARFTGAGGGGCVWAVGSAQNIEGLKKSWQGILDGVQNGQILDTRIDHQGIKLIKNG